MNFQLLIDPQGLRVMRKEMFLNVGVQGRGFDSFGNQVGNGINRVFSKSYISKRR
jgi:hypothetical protein